MQDDQMTDDDQIPGPPSQIHYLDLRNPDINGLMLNSRSDATPSAINPTFHPSSLATAPFAGIGHGLTGNTEDIPDHAKIYLRRACESMPSFPLGIIPSMSVPTLQNSGSASEQAAVAGITLSPHLVLQNPPNVRALCASQGLRSHEGEHAILPTPVNPTNDFSQDALVHIPLHQPRANNGTVPPPQRRSDIVLQVRDVLPFLSEEERDMGPYELENLGKLISNLNTINDKPDTSAGDTIHVVENFACLQSDRLRDELEDRDEEKLGDERRKSAMANIAMQTLRLKRKSSIVGYKTTVCFHVASNKQLEDKYHRSMARIEQLEDEIRRLRCGESGSSSKGPPYDDPPSGGPPPKDDGEDDDSNSGGSKGWFPRFVDQVVLSASSSSNGNFPTRSARNAQLPTGTSENLAGSTSGENSPPAKPDSHEENSAVLDSDAMPTEHSSVEDSSNGAKRRQKVNEPTVTAERMPDPTRMDKEGDQKVVSSCAILSKLATVDEHDTITLSPVSDLSAHESGRSGKFNQYPSPEVNLLPLISPSPRTIGVCRPPADIVMPELEIPRAIGLSVHPVAFSVRKLEKERRCSRRTYNSRNQRPTSMANTSGCTKRAPQVCTRESSCDTDSAYQF